MINTYQVQYVKGPTFCLLQSTPQKSYGASSRRHCDMDQTLFGAGAYNFQSISALRRIGSSSRDYDMVCSHQTWFFHIRSCARQNYLSLRRHLSIRDYKQRL